MAASIHPRLNAVVVLLTPPLWLKREICIAIVALSMLRLLPDERAGAVDESSSSRKSCILIKFMANASQLTMAASTNDHI